MVFNLLLEYNQQATASDKDIKLRLLSKSRVKTVLYIFVLKEVLFLIALKGINKSFGTVVALKEARMEVKEGEIMALLGSNGSGKSTMIKILAGLYNPNKGKIEVFWCFLVRFGAF